MKPSAKTKQPNSRPDVAAALHRAARRARTLAAQTGTPLVIVRDGRIEKLWPATAKSRPAPKRGKASSCYDLAKDLIGSVKGLPGDIATNPKSMEGFGE